MALKFILPCGKVVHVSENPRKLKRFLENEKYAVDARFWIGKIKSADRSELHTRPVNRNAVEELRTKVLLAPTNQGKIIF